MAGICSRSTYSFLGMFMHRLEPRVHTDSSIRVAQHGRRPKWTPPAWATLFHGRVGATEDETSEWTGVIAMVCLSYVASTVGVPLPGTVRRCRVGRTVETRLVACCKGHRW